MADGNLRKKLYSKVVCKSEELVRLAPCRREKVFDGAHLVFICDVRRIARRDSRRKEWGMNQNTRDDEAWNVSNGYIGDVCQLQKPVCMQITTNGVAIITNRPVTCRCLSCNCTLRTIHAGPQKLSYCAR